jgi:hypothetical protein
VRCRKGRRHRVEAEEEEQEEEDTFIRRDRARGGSTDPERSSSEPSDLATDDGYSSRSGEMELERAQARLGMRWQGDFGGHRWRHGRRVVLAGSAASRVLQRRQTAMLEPCSSDDDRFSPSVHRGDSAQAAPAFHVEGLASLLSDVPERLSNGHQPRASALAWCAQQQICDVATVVRFDGAIDDFIAALGLTRGSLGERSVRGKLEALRPPDVPAGKLRSFLRNIV